mmetsp:Transcript_14210/g.29874  ORF Transcript_14210/g.29874 Transcript_14210/m.29874 type:complete len:104 (+) Transcript_14210:254-565(+)
MKRRKGIMATIVISALILGNHASMASEFDFMRTTTRENNVSNVVICRGAGTEGLTSSASRTILKSIRRITIIVTTTWYHPKCLGLTAMMYLFANHVLKRIRLT